MFNWKSECPLNLNRTLLNYLDGITSFGIRCGVYPGVYTRVSKFASWIETNAKDVPDNSVSNIQPNMINGLFTILGYFAYKIMLK